eukprot:GHVQ01034780.1.p1 GENE.GHVQ01034780.1~~GHVQ01034780.1.p1  ORF type:complete len:196 (+),score=13.97 GHVQ01034780.1:370-957(+)
MLSGRTRRAKKTPSCLEECPICFDKAVLVTSRICGHRMCQSCADGMKKHGLNTCHMCRGSKRVPKPDICVHMEGQDNTNPICCCWNQVPLPDSGPYRGLDSRQRRDRRNKMRDSDVGRGVAPTANRDSMLSYGQIPASGRSVSSPISGALSHSSGSSDIDSTDQGGSADHVAGGAADSAGVQLSLTLHRSGHGCS